MKLKLLSGLFAIGLASLIAISAPQAQDNSGFLMTETEKNAIREIVEDYIKNNPDVIIDVLNKKAQEDAERQAKVDRRLETIPDGLYDYPMTPKLGSDNPDVTIVEFFDYNCGFCKRVINDVNRVIEEDDKVRFIFKELPILSESSETAARFALAANMQDKYLEYHTELMSFRGRLNDQILEELAQKIGLDLEQLKIDAESDVVSAALEKNMDLARELGARGTPFFVIGKEKVPGAIGYSRMKSLIQKAREEG